MKAIHAIAALTLALPSFTVHALGSSEPAQAKAADAYYVEGEVRKLDKDACKITLKHGPIANLSMPAMSMVFRAKDASMLDKLKEGDKVRFKADKVQGAYTVTEIQPAK